MRERRQARETALRILYAWEVGEWDSAWIPYEYMSDACENNEIKSYCRQLVSQIVDNLARIDSVLESYTQNWDFSRICVIDKNILRIAVAELLFLSSTPPRVAIDEALEIAKKFGGDDSNKFVNGVVDAVYREEVDNKKNVKSSSERSG